MLGCLTDCSLKLVVEVSARYIHDTGLESVTDSGQAQKLEIERGMQTRLGRHSMHIHTVAGKE